MTEQRDNHENEGNAGHARGDQEFVSCRSKLSFLLLERPHLLRVSLGIAHVYQSLFKLCQAYLCGIILDQRFFADQAYANIGYSMHADKSLRRASAQKEHYIPPILTWSFVIVPAFLAAI